MDRELKFRAWNQKKSIMVYNDEDKEGDYWDGACCGEVEMVNNLIQTKNYGAMYIWMQYTGLKDKDDVSIYEGDIVEAKCHECEQKHIFEICYMEDVCAFGIKDHKQKVRTAMYNDNGMAIDIEKVIGNVYENEDLLK